MNTSTTSQATIRYPLALRPAGRDDFKQLCRWFTRRKQAIAWGGNRLRYPLAPDQLAEDIRWPRIPSYAMVDDRRRLIGFAQVGNSSVGKHLARVAIHPQWRGQGLGEQLMTLLMQEYRQHTRYFSLFVDVNNLPAQRLYRKLGFREQPLPFERPDCLYMVAPAEVEEPACSQ